jgi:tRNA(Arg) A34 adenosine deaminase TadA
MTEVAGALPMRIYSAGGNIVDSSYIPTEHDYRMMDVALEQADLAGQNRDNPIGCVYVSPNGELEVAQTWEFRRNSLLAHAEMIGYGKIQPEAGRDLTDYSLYTIAEPCFGCAYMLDKGDIGTLFVGAKKTDAPDFFRNEDTLDAIWSKTRRTLRVVSGLRAARAVEILTNYGKQH